MPERADLAVRLEINLVILETDTVFPYSAMLMMNEEQVILLLCFHSTCLSPIQESVMKPVITITDVHEFQKAVLNSKKKSFSETIEQVLKKPGCGN